MPEEHASRLIHPIYRFTVSFTRSIIWSPCGATNRVHRTYHHHRTPGRLVHSQYQSFVLMLLFSYHPSWFTRNVLPVGFLRYDRRSPARPTRLPERSWCRAQLSVYPSRNLVCLALGTNGYMGRYIAKGGVGFVSLRGFGSRFWRGRPDLSSSVVTMSRERLETNEARRDG